MEILSPTEPYNRTLSSFFHCFLISTAVICLDINNSSCGVSRSRSYVHMHNLLTAVLVLIAVWQSFDAYTVQFAASGEIGRSKSVKEREP